MERSVTRKSRQLHKQAKRKRQRWQKALSALEAPVALIFATDCDHLEPLHCLPLLKAKQRIEELNILLSICRGDGDQPSGDWPRRGGDFRPQSPPLLRDTTPVDLERFAKLYVHGQYRYRVLVSRGELRPAAGEGWSVLTRAELTIGLATVNLMYRRRRELYVLQSELEEGGRTFSIRAWSRTWHPIFERRIVWPEN